MDNDEPRSTHLWTWLSVGGFVLVVGVLAAAFLSEVRRQVPGVFADQIQAHGQYGYTQAGIQGGGSETPAVDDDPSVGPADAPVTIIAFEDFQCPYCGQEWIIEKQILEEFEGQVRFVYRDFPILSLHDQAYPAAEAAECADAQGKFWEMHDQLFSRQTSLSTDTIYAAAQAVGLNLTTFADCVESRALYAEVQQDYTDGVQAGVTGTPTYFFNGQKLSGALPIEVFRSAINYFLK